MWDLQLWTAFVLIDGFFMPVYILKKPIVLSLMVIVIAFFANGSFISLLFIIGVFLQVIVLAKPVGDIRPFCINDCQNKFKSFEQTLEHFKSKS